MRLSVLAWSSLTALAAAQSATDSSDPSSTSSGPVVTHTIDAGNNNFQFLPHVTTANVGDIIEWRFFPLNHSVVRGAYGGNPCVPIQNTGSTEPGFASGIHDFQFLDGAPPSYQKRVNDTQPIWFYCSTIGSCDIKGMVGVINPAEGQTFAHQVALAKKAPYVLQPDEAPPAEGSAPSSAPTPSHGLSGGAIAGIVVGCVLGLAIIGALFFFVGRSKTYSDMLHGSRKKRSAPAPVNVPSFNANPEMGTYQHDDWKGPHSALTSPAFPPPYASPDQHFAQPAPGTATPYGVNVQNQYQDTRSQYSANRPAGLSRFSELGPSPSHQDRNIHELDTPLISPALVSPMRFDSGEDMQKR